MSWNLIVGPPGSGRTTRVVEVARAACRAGQLVWYVGLPAQRAYINRRVTHGGFTALGLEVMSAQQMYYRLLTGSGVVDVRPLVVGTGRLVRVAEALIEVGGRLPSPGEARLFAAAIAEAKRFAVTPDMLAATDDAARMYAEGDAPVDAERARLVAVYRAYQQAMAGSWDYDDVRLAAVELTRGARFSGSAASEVMAPLAPGADVIIVDGLRELGPLELQVLEALADHCDVYVTLPRPPSGEPPTEVLDPRPPQRVGRFLAPNPVAEARWVMRSLKRDLAEAGVDPLDLAVIAPPGRAAAIVALADEYGVPIMDETLVSLADTPAGRTLLDLLELSEAPTSSRLLAVPELVPLAAGALSAGVSGHDAIAVLADELGLTDTWREWSVRLTVHGDPVAWARGVVSEVLRLSQPRLPDGFEATVLAMAQEAARLGSGPGFQKWWAALLTSARSGRRQPGGVALLDATLASGRRFTKAYLMGATEGSYGAREREDYFISEEARTGADDQPGGDLPELPRGGGRPPPVVGLPPRLQGRDADVVAELLSRADHLVVTAPAADQSGPLIGDAALLGTSPLDLPEVPAGSSLELPGAVPYVPEFDSLDLGSPTAEYLQEYALCALKAWGKRSLPTTRTSKADDAEVPEWLALREALLSQPRLDDERLARLAGLHPGAAPWLSDHAERLRALHFLPRFRDTENDVVAVVNAGERVPVGRRGPTTSPQEGPEKFTIYLFAEPYPEADWRWAVEQLRDRWSEYLAAAIALRHPTMAPSYVEFVVWPIYGAPIVVENSSRRYAKERMATVVREIAGHARRFRAGDLTPSPGFACRDCGLYQVCRVRELA